MWVLYWCLTVAGWVVWLCPFLFLAPHRQKRPSVTAAGPTRAGILLETAAIFLAFAFATPGVEPGAIRLAPAVVLGAVSVAMAWQAVRHLGRQFRITAGLYDDHALIRTGPYAIVRHPIYSSMMGMLIATLVLLRTPWPWAALALAIFIVGTELRVRAEDALLESRFHEDFRAYRKTVSAYIPFMR